MENEHPFVSSLLAGLLPFAPVTSTSTQVSSDIAASMTPLPGPETLTSTDPNTSGFESLTVSYPSYSTSTVTGFTSTVQSTLMNGPTAGATQAVQDMCDQANLCGVPADENNHRAAGTIHVHLA